MPRLLAQSSILLSGFVSGIDTHREGRASILWRNLSSKVGTWVARRRERQSLGDLSEMDYLLDDIGMSRQQALREAAKPFWER